MFVASSERQTRRNCYNNDCKNCIRAHSARKFCAKQVGVQRRALSLIARRIALTAIRAPINPSILLDWRIQIMRTEPQFTIDRKMKTRLLTLLILFFASVVLADFKTIKGKEYKNA